MGIEENKKMMQRYFDELHNKQDYSKAGEILHEDYSGGAAEYLKGVEGLKRYSNYMHSIASDCHWETLEMIAEGEKIVVFGEWSGTFDGEYGGIKGNGRPFKRLLAAIYEFKDGKVYRGLTRVASDILSTYQQLGILPPTEEIHKTYIEAHK